MWTIKVIAIFWARLHAFVSPEHPRTEAFTWLEERLSGVLTSKSLYGAIHTRLQEFRRVIYSGEVATNSQLLCAIGRERETDRNNRKREKRGTARRARRTDRRHDAVLVPPTKIIVLLFSTVSPAYATQSSLLYCLRLACGCYLLCVPTFFLARTCIPLPSPSGTTRTTRKSWIENDSPCRRIRARVRKESLAACRKHFSLTSRHMSH